MKRRFSEEQNSGIGSVIQRLSRGCQFVSSISTSVHMLEGLVLSKEYKSVNGTLIALLASIGVPTAAVGLVVAIMALLISNNSKQDVIELTEAAKSADGVLVQHYIDEIAAKAVEQSREHLTALTDNYISSAQEDLNLLLAKQEKHLALLDAALTDALATIDAVDGDALQGNGQNFGEYRAEVYQMLAGIGVNWQETKGTDFVVQAVERSAPQNAMRTQSTDTSAQNSSEQTTVGSVEAGKRKFSQCASCHSVNEGGRNGVGPNLWNVYEDALASKAGFSYSNALKTFGGNWTAEQLDLYLTNPRNYIRGTKMSFAGLRNEEDRANVIAYLKSLQ